MSMKKMHGKGVKIIMNYFFFVVAVDMAYCTEATTASILTLAF